jgi:ankyrin repeat protein
MNFATWVHAGIYDEFHEALKDNNVAAMQALLLKGIDPNTPDEQGQTALMLAIRNGHFDVAELFIKHVKIQPNITNAHDENALMLAGLVGNAAWVQKLLALGASIDKNGWTPLHYAATGPNAETVKIMLAYGARINARSPNGTTPLMMAAQYGTEATVKLLLKEGADMDAVNDLDLKAADFALLGERTDLAKWLIQLAKPIAKKN